MAPSSARQLAPPVTTQFSMPAAPSIRVVQPCLRASLAQPNRMAAANTQTMPAINRLIAFLR